MARPEDGTPPAGFSLLRGAIRRPVAVMMIALGVLVFGMVAYQRLSVALMPRFSHPTLTVRTEFPGSAPEEVEQFVTAPLEKALSIVSGLVEVRSVSLAGFSELVLEFQWGTDLGLALLEVRERLDRLVLPGEAQKPLLLRFDPEEAAVLRMALVAPYPPARLREVAEEQLKPALQTIPGVAFVRVGGGAALEVKVELDEGLLTRLGLSVAQVRARLNEENINLAGGVLLEGKTEYRVRTLNELATLDEVREVLVSPPGRPPVRLADIGPVTLGAGQVAVRASADGREAVEIEVFKEADANVVAVARHVREAVWGRLPSGPPKARTGGRRRGPSAGRGRGGGGSPPALPLAERLVRSLSGAGGRPSPGGALGWAAPGGPGGELRLIADRSRFIDQALGEVRRTAVVGALLAMGVLFLFLGRFRTTLFVAVAIPLSVVAAFLLMFITGLTLNMISLGGLALGVGMLVDNAIVVLEAMHRLRRGGLPLFEAAAEGLREVGGAVTASTLTTVAVFLPLVFLEGIAGQLFNDLALTVVFGLLASLLVALFVLPMLFVNFPATEEGPVEGPVEGPGQGPGVWGAPPPGTPHPWGPLREDARRRGAALQMLVRGLLAPPWWRRVAWFPYRAPRLALAALGALLGMVALGCAGGVAWSREELRRRGGAALARLAQRVVDRAALWLENATAWYQTLLRRALARGPAVLAGAGLASLLALWWGVSLERQLMPPLHQGLLQVRVELPPGTPLAATTAAVRGLEQTIRPLAGVAATFARAGEEPDAQSAERGGENVGLIWVTLAARTRLAEAEAAMAETIGALLAGNADWNHRVAPPPLFTLKPPIEVEVRGENLAALESAATQVAKVLGTLPQLTGVRAQLKPGGPEIQVQFHRSALARHGLTAKGVAEIVRGKLSGESALEFRADGKKVGVRVRVQQPQLDSAAKLAHLTVNPGAATPVPLEAVATLLAGRGAGEIRRVAQQRAALVTASVAGSDLGAGVVAAQQALAGLRLPPGISLAVSGQSREMARSLRSLFFALLLAVFLVFLVMAAQFESLLQPLVILLSIPLAGIGVVAVLWAAGQTLDILVGIGLIVLAGIVVNNAIVLVNTVNLLTGQGVELGEAIVAGAVVRLRPILMTTATTVLGLMPLVLDAGAGVEIRRPIALTVIAGLVSAMVLTLVVIPCALRMLGAAGGDTWGGDTHHPGGPAQSEKPPGGWQGAT